METADGPQEHSVSLVLEAKEGLFNHCHLNIWDKDSGEPRQAAEGEALGLGTETSIVITALVIPTHTRTKVQRIQTSNHQKLIPRPETHSWW